MAHAELVALASRLVEKYHLSKGDAETFVSAFFDILQQGLKDDRIAKVKSLGTFKLITVKDRESVDVNTGERIVIEGRDKISFTPDKILAELINKPFAQFDTVVVNEGVDFSGIDREYEEQESTAEAAPAVSEEDHAHAASVHAAASTAPVDGNESTAGAVPCGGPSSERRIAPKEQRMEPERTAAPVEPTVSVAPAEPTAEAAPVEPTVSAAPAEPTAEAAPVASRHSLSRFSFYFFCGSSVVLLIGLIFLSFLYGRVAGERDNLQAQLGMLKQQVSMIQAKTGQPSAREAALQAKRQADSVALLRQHQAIEAAAKGGAEADAATAGKAAGAAAGAKVPAAKKVAAAGKEQPAASPYAQAGAADPRVRTGAYEIVGIDHVVTVKAGQTLQSISRSHLGPGMECYVEAINGSSAVKAGEKVKIPKLRLKKK
ncbi:HU family DNA-binding protein [Prevotella sp. AGR2160]|uniref:HU family DNA-binding protein n=1 Tax=Prevotella sp. AGR2160 TaxID=1280674 RepID=UPI00040D9FA0|nr:HU family DNA-binding protein [Prevotella sp. AGR2160]